MTILAWDSRYLAVDSRVTMGGIVVNDTFNKMYEVNHPKLGPLVCAVTGACDFIGPWMESITEHGFAPVNIPGMDDDYSMSGIFVDSKGDAWEVSSSGGYFHLGKNVGANGSAVETAFYLLKKGKSALNVVKEICDNNLFCGGDIKVFDSKTGKITIYKKE